MTGPQGSQRRLLGRIARYGVAGVLATLIYAGVVLLLVEAMGLTPVPAAAIATVVVIVTSYVVNRAWVFDTARSHRSAFTRFVIASLLGITINTGLMYLAVHWLDWPYIAGVVLATLVVPPLNFIVNYLWAFGQVGTQR